MRTKKSIPVLLTTIVVAGLVAVPAAPSAATPSAGSPPGSSARPVAGAAGGAAGTTVTTATPAAPSCTVADPGPRLSGPSVPLKATTSSTAAGVIFVLDGKPIGHGFPAAGDTVRRSFSYAAYGTKADGWPSTSVKNGPKYQLSCYAYGPGGTGPVGPARTVMVKNPARARITGIVDQREFVPPRDPADESKALPLPLTVTFVGDRLPASATFTMDGRPLGQAPCSVTATETASCTYQWDIEATTSARDWEIAKGLRVIGATGVAGGATITAAPVRTLIGDHPGSTMLLSSYEREGLGRVGRDGGWSAPLPADPSKTFVTFGDGLYIPLTGPDRKPESDNPADMVEPRFGNTSTIGPVGTDSIGPLVEVPNPLRDPFNAPPKSPITDSPQATKADGSPCSNPATWTVGVIAKPGSNNLLVGYWSICWDTFSNQVFGIAEWDPATNTVVSRVEPFVRSGGTLPEQMQLQSPTTDGTYLYWWRSHPTERWLARVPVSLAGNDAPWADAANYQWFSSDSGWTSDHTQATSLSPGVGLSTLSSVARIPQLAGNPWLMITHNFGGQVQAVNIADRPEGPWRPVPEWQSLNICTGCDPQYSSYSYYSHPEASSAQGLLVSYSEQETNRTYQRFLPWPASLQARLVGTAKTVANEGNS